MCLDEKKVILFEYVYRGIKLVKWVIGVEGFGVDVEEFDLRVN